ncbi:tape measure protein [Sphingobium sp. HT1-2]|uniref:tape measure protein n=1 Tax=Sphingobium sp. HT1-2 TaxID=3111640 RepID=UPI003BFF0AEC
MSQPVASPHIDIIIDSKSAQAGAQRVNAALNSISAQASSLNSGLSGVNGTMIQTGSSAQQLAQRLQAANSNAAGLGGMLGRLQGVATGAAGSIGNLGASFAGLGGLAVAGGVAAIGAAIVAVGTAVTSATAQVQAYKASLTTIIGDTEKAGLAFDALADFAQRTPFTLDEAVNGFVKLSALGLKPSEEAMTSYGNTAAAMGKSLEQMVEAVADASTSEFERLKEFGIKSKQEGDKVSFTFQGVTTQVGNNAADIQKYLIGIGNTQFAGGMDRQAQTIGGAIAALGDQIFILFAKIGQGGFASGMTKILDGISSGIAAITPLLSGVGSVLGGIINFVAEVASGFGSMFTAMTGGGKESLGLLDLLTVGFNVLGQWVTVAGNTVGAVFRGIANVIQWVGGGIREWMGKAFTWLTGASTATVSDMGLSFIALLRSVKYVAGAIPDLFATAFQDVKKLFGNLGSIVGRLLSGDLAALGDIGSAFTVSFANSAKQMGSIVDRAAAVAADQKGAQGALDRMLGRGKTAKIDDFAKETPGVTPTGAVDKDAAKAAADAAKAEAERQKRIQEYWQTLDNSVTLSKMLPLEAEKHSKFLELQKLYGDKLSDQDKAALAAAQGKIASKLREIALGKSITSMADQARQIENSNLIMSGKKLGLTEQEAGVQDALAKLRIDALNGGATLADLASDTWKTEEKRLETALRTQAALEGQAAAIAKAKDIAAGYSPEYDRAQRIAGIEKDRADFLKSADAAGIGKGVQKSVLTGMGNAIDAVKAEAIYEFSDGIHALADEFGGAFGKAIGRLGKAMDRIAAATSGDLNNAGPFGSVAKMLGGDVADSFKDGAKGLFKDFGDDIGKLFGANGDFSKTLGKTLGQMGAGAQVGSIAGNLASMAGIKTSATGSMVGGALGSFAGPIGSAVGGLLGGIVGGMFKKAKWATGQIDLVGGDIATGSVTGNKNAYRENAGVAGGAVGSSIEQIAESLGAIITGDPNISIGQYKGAWRVSSTGRTGKLKGKYSDVTDFGDDGEAAVAYAAQLAIQQGVLSGLSSFADRALRNSNDGNFESVLATATQFENLMKELAAFDDPLGAAVDNVNSSLDKLISQMKGYGATADDLAQVERYRSIQLDKIIADQTSSLRDLQKTLSGEGSGRTVLQRLNSSLDEYAGYQADLASGKSIDNDAFASLANEIFGLAGSAYGTSTGQFQSILSMLKSDNAAAISATEDRVMASQDAAAAAQQKLVEQNAAAAQQRDQLLAEQAKANALSAEQNALLRELVARGGLGNAFANALGYVNGVPTARTV